MNTCLVLIGSSTGGVEALSELLSQYPRACPPTIIVQHTGEAFGGSLVRLLNGRCSANVVPAQSGLRIKPGTICVAAGYRAHLSIASGLPVGVRLIEGRPVSGHIPSVDVTFKSAVPHAKRTVACLLTGMGSDGAEGLLRLREAGARTLAQDQSSCVVYGMPRVAWEIGGAQQQVHLKDMCRTILKSCEELANRV